MIVSSIWIGDRLSRMERLVIRSHQLAGHTFRLYAYGKLEGVPADVEIVDAATVLPPQRIFRSSNGAVGDFANLFKYYALADFGGCWTEMDEVCLRPWTELGAFISSEADESGGVHIDQAAISIEAGHVLLTSLIAECEVQLSALRGAPFMWGTFGVGQFARAVKAHGLEARVVPPGAFCPLPWWQAVTIWRPEAQVEIPRDAYGIQLWNEAWRREGWDKERAPAGSLYAKLCDALG